MRRQPPTLADGAGNLTTFVYDGFDRLSRQRYPNASGGGASTTDYEEFTYNGASAVISVRRRDNQLVAFSYDNLLRVSNMDAPGTVNDVAYVYDLFSRTLSAGSLTFAYDQLSRLTSAVAAQGAVSYLYDSAGRRTRMTWPDGFYVAYDYDVAGAVTAIRENGAASGAGVLASFGYDDLGRRVSLTRGNGAVTTYGFDPVSRLSTLTQNLPGTSHDQTYGFSYNAASQIGARTSTNAAYNAPLPLNGTTTYADNGLNQYTNVDAGVGGQAPTYDARGNLTAFAGAAYGYDVFNRLTSATPAGASAATLAYDALGRLRETAAGAATTRFLYDGLDAIAEYNASNVLQRRYVHGPGVDEPLVWYEGSGTSDRRYLVQDERGSVVAINAAANSVNAYDEYGVPGAANTGRFQYTGQMWLGEAGVYHYKARAYLPQLGRFAQTDPIGFAGGMNIYAYVGNDPVNFIDPLGLDWCQRTVIYQWTETVRYPDGTTITQRGWDSELELYWCPNDQGGGGGSGGGDGDGRIWENETPTVGQRGFQCPSAEQVNRWTAMVMVGESMSQTGGVAMVVGAAGQTNRGMAVPGRILVAEGAAMASVGGVMSSVAYALLASHGHEQDAFNALMSGRMASGFPQPLQPAVAAVAQGTLAGVQQSAGVDFNTCPPPS